MPHSWADWLCHFYRLGCLQNVKAEEKSKVAHKWADWLHHPYPLGGPQHFHGGGQNLKWPLDERIACITLGGLPTL